MSTSSPTRHPIAQTRAGRLTFWVVFALVTACVAAFVHDPAGPALAAFLVCWLGLLVAITIGPILRRAQPRRIWAIETLAGIALMLTVYAKLTGDRLGPFALLDITYFACYFLFALWLTAILRHVIGPRAGTSVIDSAAAGVGIGLALWSLALAPMVGSWQAPLIHASTVYPVIDIIMLALAVHLAVRLKANVPAMRWFIAGIAIQFTLDTVNAMVLHLAPHIDTTRMGAFFLYWLFCLAVAATHASVVNVTRRPPQRPRTPSPRAVTLVMALAASPALISTLVPVSGAIDLTVRSVLVAVLLGLLVTRLRATVAALSRAEAESRHRATHDQLTGLHNRAALLDELKHLLELNARRERRTAVLFFDCDNFKHINDTWGHLAGDNLLVDIANSLPRILSKGDVFARQGGDEFVICTTVTYASEALELAAEVERFFDTPLRILPGRVHAVTSSIGVAIAEPGEQIDIETLLGKADVAMYEAKHRARGRSVLFQEELEMRTRTRAEVGDRLDAALSDGLFSVELQPVLGGTGYDDIVGWEALARWHDPHLGTVPPSVFVPLAEQLGIIGRLGEIVLRNALAELNRLREQVGDDHLGVFVNVSPAQLLEPGFADLVVGVLADARLPRYSLNLEVTETMLIDEGPAVDDVLRALRAAGARVILDDFGSGYASLATLMRLPVDGVKLDKSLTQRLGVEPEADRQVGAVIDLIHSLGVDAVIAEGVETVEQEAALAQARHHDEAIRRVSGSSAL